MDDDPKKVCRGKLRIIRLNGIFLLSVMVFGFLPPVSHMMGWSFLSSQAYVDESLPAALVFAALSCASMMFAMRSTTSNIVDRYDWFKNALAVMTWGLVSLNAVLAGLPMARALGAPVAVSLPYVVGSGIAVRCHDAITFKGLPPFANSICNMPREVRIYARQAGMLMIDGEGSSWGIFPQALRSLPQDG